MTFWRSAAVICRVGEIQTSSLGKPLSAGSCVLGTCDAIPLQEQLFNCLNMKWHEGPWLQPQFWSCWPVAPPWAAGAAHVSSIIWKLKCRSTDQIRLLDKEEDALSFWSLGLVCFVFLLFFFNSRMLWWQMHVFLMGGQCPWLPKDVPGGCRGGRAAPAWFLQQIIIPTAFSARYGANPAPETQHHRAWTDQFDDGVTRVQAVSPTLRLYILQGLCWNCSRCFLQCTDHFPHLRGRKKGSFWWLVSCRSCYCICFSLLM